MGVVNLHSSITVIKEGKVYLADLSEPSSSYSLERIAATVNLFTFCKAGNAISKLLISNNPSTVFNLSKLTLISVSSILT